MLYSTASQGYGLWICKGLIGSEGLDVMGLGVKVV
jgi:hypothetical protein